MPVQRLKDFLDEHQVKYVVITHSRAFTTQEIASLTHIPGKELAKTVIVDVDGETAMAVLPGSQKVDLALLRDALGAERVIGSTDCGFASTASAASVSGEVAWLKLAALVEGAHRRDRDTDPAIDHRLGRQVTDEHDVRELL